mmetsp:Transcript_15024/g.26467  ORF Transcript_15024/g.26467 Transcript_15024/m.26467 type:complete len:224 (+) Transcript_15024:424-1095(+)
MATVPLPLSPPTLAGALLVLAAPAVASKAPEEVLFRMPVLGAEDEPHREDDAAGAAVVATAEKGLFCPNTPEPVGVEEVPKEPKPTEALGAKALAVGFNDFAAPQGLLAGEVLVAWAAPKAAPNKPAPGALAVAGAENGPDGAEVPKKLAVEAATGDVAVTVSAPALVASAARVGLNMDAPAPKMPVEGVVVAAAPAKGLPVPILGAVVTTAGSFAGTSATAG